MLAKAIVRYVRIAPRKVKLVIDLIRGKTVEEAIFILASINKKASGLIQKVIMSAFSNANFNRQDKLLSKELFISKIVADGGPMFKRYRAATMGRAAPIKHRTTHIYVELDRIGQGKEKPSAEKARSEKVKVESEKAETKVKELRSSRVKKSRAKAKKAKVGV